MLSDPRDAVTGSRSSPRDRNEKELAGGLYSVPLIWFNELVAAPSHSHHTCSNVGERFELWPSQPIRGRAPDFVALAESAASLRPPRSCQPRDQ
jgi:hypothetical protein